MTSPEQSNEFGPSAPQTYGLPIWFRAHLTIQFRVSVAPAATSEINNANIIVIFDFILNLF